MSLSRSVAFNLHNKQTEKKFRKTKKLHSSSWAATNISMEDPTKKMTTHGREEIFKKLVDDRRSDARTELWIALEPM